MTISVKAWKRLFSYDSFDTAVADGPRRSIPLEVPFVFVV
jgi:hypothetical protein